MNCRQWIGLKPTVANLAHDLLRAARQSGQTGWAYDAADSDTHGGNELFMNQDTHVWRWDREGTSKPPARPPWCPGPTRHASSATISSPPPKTHLELASMSSGRKMNC